MWVPACNIPLPRGLYLWIHVTVIFDTTAMEQVCRGSMLRHRGVRLSSETSPLLRLLGKAGHKSDAREISSLLVWAVLLLNVWLLGLHDYYAALLKFGTRGGTGPLCLGGGG